MCGGHAGIRLTHLETKEKDAYTTNILSRGALESGDTDVLFYLFSVQVYVFIGIVNSYSLVKKVMKE